MKNIGVFFMTLNEMKQQKVRLQAAYYELLEGKRLSKGDVDGLGMAEFSEVTARTIEIAIDRLDIQIKKAQGKRTRMFGTPLINC
jgi:hypothetical protein|tara:strand:- start:219 stop:473 length:255 start_codon:yes stop_codon:yes gene_type:complete